jgi:hypothetical protein
LWGRSPSPDTGPCPPVRLEPCPWSLGRINVGVGWRQEGSGAVVAGALRGSGRADIGEALEEVDARAAGEGWELSGEVVVVLLGGHGPRKKSSGRLDRSISVAEEAVPCCTRSSLIESDKLVELDVRDWVGYFAKNGDEHVASLNMNIIDTKNSDQAF